MENLWKTDGSGASNANYIDIFAIAQKKFGKCFNEWDNYINLHVNQLQTDGTFKKCNQTAKKFLKDGHANFNNGNYWKWKITTNACVLLNWVRKGKVWRMDIVQHVLCE